VDIGKPLVLEPSFFMKISTEKQVLRFVIIFVLFEIG
jgi:hypothetical protein